MLVPGRASHERNKQTNKTSIADPINENTMFDLTDHQGHQKVKVYLVTFAFTSTVIMLNLVEPL